MFGLALCKNEEYTLYLAYVGLAAGSHSVRTKNIHRIQRVVALAHFKNEKYTLYLACALARFKNEEYTSYSACDGSHALRTKNIHVHCI